MINGPRQFGLALVFPEKGAGAERFEFGDLFKDFALRFSVRADDPEASWGVCLDQSAMLIEGHRWELFCLELSFIVGALACGFGMRWVAPEQHAAVANFCEARKNHM